MRFQRPLHPARRRALPDRDAADGRRAFHISGEIRELDPPSRFAFTFICDQPNPDDVANLVSLSFHDLGGSTEVDVAQGPFTTEERRAVHMASWNDSFDRMERLLASSA